MAVHTWGLQQSWLVCYPRTGEHLALRGGPQYRTQRQKGADREGCQEEVRPRLDPRVDGSQMSRTR